MTSYLSKFVAVRRKLSLSSSSSGCKYEPSHCMCLGALEGSGFDLGETVTLKDGSMTIVQYTWQKQENTPGLKESEST